MYIIFSFDIHDETSVRKTLMDKIKKCLEPFEQLIEPLDTFYLIKLKHEKDKSEFCACLKKLLAEYSGIFEYFVSPVITSKTACYHLLTNENKKKIFLEITN